MDRQYKQLFWNLENPNVRLTLKYKFLWFEDSD